MSKNSKTSAQKKPSVYIHTFGCQMNVNDSERIAGILAAEGAQPSNTIEDSDIIIVNTCAVREKSVDKLHSFLGRLNSLKKRKKIKIWVAGCVAQLYRSELLERNPCIDVIIGPDNYWKIPEIFSNQEKEKIISTTWSRKWHEIPHVLILRNSRTSAYVTIMEGCNNFCSYCVVPFTRGREKFKPMQNILMETKDLAKKGYKEIQLLGQNVNSYNDPMTGKRFSDLLKEVNKIDGIEWIRFISSHPKDFTIDIARMMKKSKKVCNQLHLPLQSGSSTVLKSMKRGYTREEYLKKISILRDLMPDISLSTDIIVGFPGETEKDFCETLGILREVRFTNIFSFRYSPRPLASSALTKDSIPFIEKKRRLTELQNLQKEIQLNTNKSLIGRVMRVLCLGRSKKDPEIYSGRNEGYQVINFQSKNNVSGKFVNVKITGCGPHSLIGTAIP